METQKNKTFKDVIEQTKVKSNIKPSLEKRFKHSKWFNIGIDKKEVKKIYNRIRKKAEYRLIKKYNGEFQRYKHTLLDLEFDKLFKERYLKKESEQKNL
jgi:hypothetical protein